MTEPGRARFLFQLDGAYRGGETTSLRNGEEKYVAMRGEGTCNGRGCPSQTKKRVCTERY